MDPHNPLPSLPLCVDALTEAKDDLLCRCALDFQSLFDAEPRMVEIRSWLARSYPRHELQTEIMLSPIRQEPENEPISALCALVALSCPIDPNLPALELETALVRHSHELDDERGSALATIQSEYGYVKTAFSDIDSESILRARTSVRIAIQAILIHALLPHLHTDGAIYPALASIPRLEACGILRHFGRAELASSLEARLIAETALGGASRANRASL